MRFGLEEHIIEKLIEVFEANPKVDKALVFGSRAKGNYRKDSDIDIAIKGHKITLDDILQLSVAFEDNNIKHKIDLIDYTTIKEPDLKDHIDRVGIEFYSRWKKYKFSDFVTINPTVSLKGKEEYSFVEMKDLQDGNKYCFPKIKRKPSSGARFQERDTLFARITPCLENGKICQVKNLVNNVGFGSTEFLVFRGKENISDNEFVFYLSRWEDVRDFAENNFEGTSGRQRVPKNCFENLKLELPPLSEQIQIANILSSLDDKIDVLHQQNKTLEQLAETLFRTYFNMEELDNVVTLDEFVECINGVSYKSAELNPSKVGMASLKSFDRKGGFRLDGFKDFTGKYKESQVVVEGDLIVAHTDITQDAEVIGNPALVIEDPIYETMVISMDIVKVVSKLDWIDNAFLYYLMRTREFKSHCEGCANGSTVLHLSKQAIPTFEFPKPDKKKVTEFSKQANEILKKIFSNHKQLKNLTQLRDTLLPKLMSGEVRVKM
jgi:type I restriction enzyme S subunit